MTDSATPIGSIWKNRTFFKMFSAYSLSTFGDWFDLIAITVLIAYKWNSDPMMIALVPVMFALPGILFGSFAGVLADRWPKVKVMIVADILVALLTLGLMFAPNIYWVLPILALRSTLGVFNIPAQQALTRHVVAEDHLLKATSYNGIVNQLSKVAGPILGSAVLTVAAPQICILINAIARFGSAVILMTIRGVQETQNEQTATDKEKTSFRQEWAEGWVHIWRTKAVLYTILLAMLAMLGIQLVDFQLATIFREYAPDNETLVGWCMAASGAGAAISMMWLNRRNKIQYGWALGGGILLIGFGFGAMGFVEPAISHLTSLLFSLLIAFFGLVAGFGVGLWAVAFGYLLQKETPKESIGRVFGIQNMMSSAVVVVAPLLGGVLIKWFGAVTVYMWIGVSLCMLGLIAILFQKQIWPSQVQAGEAKAHVAG